VLGNTIIANHHHVNTCVMHYITHLPGLSVYQEHSKINSLPILCHFTFLCLSYIAETEGDLPFKKEVKSALYV